MSAHDSQRVMTQTQVPEPVTQQLQMTQTQVPEPVNQQPQMTQTQAPEPVHQQPPPQPNLPEHLMYKNRLQEYVQRSSLPLPIYETVNEGSQHSPRFKSTVLVDGTCYKSPNTFLHRKAAEQDVARIALDAITQNIKDVSLVRCPILEDTIFCKSILNEYATKMRLERPTYETKQPEGLLPTFVSSLLFNGDTYTGVPGRNKKEAEQLAARSAILSILGKSESGTKLSEIINSKSRLYAALHKVKETDNSHNGIVPVASNTATSLNLPLPLSKGKEVEAAGGTGIVPSTAVLQTCSSQLITNSPANQLITNSPAMHQPFHEYKRPKLEPSAEAATLPIVFVPPVAAQPPVIGSSSGRKQNRKNKRKAKKKVQIVAPASVDPLNQVPPCSVASVQ